MASDLADRFRKLTDRSGDCWLWQGYTMPNGYGQFNARRVLSEILAHRVAHRLYLGPIPEGYEVDHMCRNRACVNPDHLQAVPPGYNGLQGNKAKGERPACGKGHIYTAGNTYIGPQGVRVCRACKREQYHQRKRNKTSV